METKYDICLISQDSLFPLAIMEILRRLNLTLKVKYIQDISLFKFYNCNKIFLHESSLSEFIAWSYNNKNHIPSESIFIFVYELKDLEKPFVKSSVIINQNQIITTSSGIGKLTVNVKMILKKVNVNNFLIEELSKLYKEYSFLLNSSHFTEEELDIIYKLRRFSDNKILADKCNLSLSTIKRRLKTIAEKCGVPNQKTALLNYFYENQILKL